MITSLQNKRVKDALKLRRRSGRDDQSRFLIDGLREIEQALLGNVEILEAFHCESQGNDRTNKVANKLREAGCELLEVSEPVWQKINYGNRQDGVLAVARCNVPSLGAIELQGDGPIVVLDQIEKPGNIGAVFRTATAAGAAAVILSNPATDFFNPNAIRASLGTLFRLPAAPCSAEEALHWLKHQAVPIFVARVDATDSAFDANLRQRCAIVLGSEAHGVSHTWLDDSLSGLSLPMVGPIDSLNVANSAAVLLYEALRQRLERAD